MAAVAPREENDRLGTEDRNRIQSRNEKCAARSCRPLPARKYLSVSALTRLAGTRAKHCYRLSASAGRSTICHEKIARPRVAGKANTNKVIGSLMPNRETRNCCTGNANT